MSQPATNPDITMIDIGRVLPNPLNPRGEISDSECAELAASMASVGILQPLLVTPYRDAFYAVAGHRRRTAAKIAGLTRLPCIVRELTDVEQLDIMMIENIQRQDLAPYQEARGFESMMKLNGSGVSDLVRRLGLSANYINARLDILKLHVTTQKAFYGNDVPLGAASILKTITDIELQRRFANQLINGTITLKALEQAARTLCAKERLAGTSAATRPSTGRRNETRQVLATQEMFTRSEALALLASEGSVSFEMIGKAFNDICDGVCSESAADKLMCQSCPAPRMIASILRRAGVDVKGTIVV